MVEELGALSHEELFDRQIETWRRRGCPEDKLMTLKTKRHRVLRRASSLLSSPRRLPFLPVFSRKVVKVYEQMQWVRLGDRIGHNRLDLSLAGDRVESPEKVYYIFDVDLGLAEPTISSVVEQEIKKSGRLGLTIVEMISVAIQTDVWVNGILVAIGSRYQTLSFPCLKLSDGWPTLTWLSSFKKDLPYHIASASRVKC